MTVLELISEGLELMVIGMTVVFVFLGVLVILVTSMSRLAQKFGPTAVVPAPSSAGSSGAPDDLIAVIGAAVHQYRNKKRR